ncbi:MAG: amidohydrolase [Candidatus Brocadia sinica]|uniref:Amidohydrolase n=1 Tax=Candidatus Brocadia sinica JPN1 TaxID=1197129 RepID=A0ABQ0JXL3_9BACT|nr:MULTISPECIES: amidohydrolase [Brocadia]KXK25536.1 MAG: amidohydrolase [Candidatus Brocadia sinica]MCK6467910.1 amidohydrolase [Candidatus Brocadia sinica]GAN33492.1 amidohydrolase [Candidatus Brocadia sinica JPN1]GIK13323.1 MAG: amidohydrolase [Candidatus Brocadia sinica]GJQ19052.1 MAG: amidohydrolase [Candidatus Brocadia sinica]
MQTKPLTQEILAHAKEAHDYVIRMRRDFHKHPETGFTEIRTSGVIAEELKRLGLHVQTDIAKTGVVGSLYVDGASSTVAFRADMDALPILEENNLEFKSQNEGISHACGHDANMAMLLGAARLMVQLKDKLKRQVKFIFQPCEEQHPGGAKVMVEQGVLHGVDEIYGLHIEPNIPSGTFGVRDGATMAATDRIAITLIGKGGHASTPHLCVDPIVTAAEVILAIQTIISRKVNPLSPCVVSLCQISGGTTFNVIPDKVKIIGTVRTLAKELRYKMPILLEETVRGITSLNNATYQFEYFKGHPPLYNPRPQADFIQNKIIELFGSKSVEHIDPKMGGEDFSYYLEKIKGAYVFLGSGNLEKGASQPLHSSRFLLDEDVLSMGPALFTYIACSP